MPRTRKIVQIDEARCDGCGDCLASCAEGAIVLQGGKARLAADVLCDGLGACLGECPRGAIAVVEREAEPFDAAAVARQAHPAASPRPARRGLAVVSEPSGPAARAGRAGALRTWPVQLALVPVGAPFLRGADLLLAADCVAFACPTFHAELAARRVVAIGCPKLDALPAHAEKLGRILARADGPTRVTVARMEVPCCAALTAAARHAAAHAGREVPVHEVVVGVDGVVTAE